jgi:hypothetical protein
LWPLSAFTSLSLVSWRCVGWVSSALLPASKPRFADVRCLNWSIALPFFAAFFKSKLQVSTYLFFFNTNAANRIVGLLPHKRCGWEVSYVLALLSLQRLCVREARLQKRIELQIQSRAIINKALTLGDPAGQFERLRFGILRLHLAVRRREQVVMLQQSALVIGGTHGLKPDGRLAEHPIDLACRITL